MDVVGIKRNKFGDRILLNGMYAAYSCYCELTRSEEFHNQLHKQQSPPSDSWPPDELFQSLNSPQYYVVHTRIQKTTG